MAKHNDFGKEAENKAAEFLEQKGYQILSKNYRYQKAEIDIIAKFENQIIIVEVKARSNDAFIEPYEAVNKNKIRLFTFAASQFLEENNIDLETRFDIVSILVVPHQELQIQHMEGAFESIEGI